MLAKPSPAPAAPGIYAWYFDELPAGDIDTRGCHHHAGLPLLYTGISPKRPPASGAPASRQNLRKRVRYHYRGNAYGSTLRLTLGCLLAEQLGIELRRVSGTRLTFGDGEAVVSDWMAEHAFVCWLPTPTPWEIESQLIGELDLPLNLDQNRGNAFHPRLTARRAAHRARAREVPILDAWDSLLM